MTKRVLAHLGLAAGGVLAALLLLAGAELALRLLGVAERPRRDPFAGFSRTVPLFEPAQRDDGTPVYRFSEARQGAMTGSAGVEAQREFLREKPPGSFRVFAVGDSSAAGVPYATDYAFPAWLARRLEAELPAMRFEVVNAAVSGYATRRILTVVQELAAYQPDLLIVYAGHNEIAERRFYAHLLDLDPRLFRLWEWLAGTRVYGSLAQLLGSATREPPRIDLDDTDHAAQMFAVLGGRAAGSSPYPSAREIAWGENLYRFNLEQMTRTAREAGARVLLVGQAQDFASWAPGASEHRPGLSAAELSRWEQSFGEGARRAGQGDCAGALAAWEDARAIDDAYAELAFRTADCERALGRYGAARDDYRRASDLDRVPHGASTRYNAIAREVAAAEGALYVDADFVLEQASEHGLVGDALFTDFVHPRIEGHVRIAGAVADALRAAGVPAPALQWQAAAWSDPDLEPYRRDPELVAREHLVRALACVLAARDACALAEAEAVLVTHPDHQAALALRDKLRRKKALD